MNYKSKNSSKNVYDDGNIPEVDLPKNNVEPLPESSQTTKDDSKGEGK